MLKTAYQLGIQAAFNELDLEKLAVSPRDILQGLGRAGKAVGGGLSRAGRGIKNKAEDIWFTASPQEKALMVGAGGLGTGIAAKKVFDALGITNPQTLFGFGKKEED